MVTDRLTRNMLNRVLGGVCGGIGSYLGISGWWVRAAFAALVLTNVGLGLLLYVLLWFIIPGQTLADLPPILHPGEPRTPRYARPEGMLLLGAGTIVIGAVLLAQGAGILQGSASQLLTPGMLFIIGLVLLAKHLRGTA